VARISHGTGNLLYWNYFQRRSGEPKRPFFIVWPVQIPFTAASAERRDRESVGERALLFRWVHSTKHSLDSIGKFAQLSQDRFSDREFGKFLYRNITEDIRKAGLLLDGLLNYLQVTTPIRKTNTVNNLIEEALEKNQSQLEERGVKLLKRLEEDLPEIIVPDEQLKYILNSVLRYLVTSTLSKGTIEFLTKSFVLERGTEKAHSGFKEYGGYIEISVIFVGDRETAEKSEAALGRIAFLNKDEMSELMLHLAREMVLKNRGTMKLEADEKRAKKIISLGFPTERRKEGLYEHININ
jgi:signal transduction histidine kinase